MDSKYLKDFQSLNTTTKSIYNLENLDVLIITKDGTNLTDWNDVDNNEDIIYISENLSDYTDLSNKYRDFSSLKAVVSLGLSDEVTTTKNMFYGCSSLADISSLKDWNVSNVENMAGMFYGCNSLVDVSPLKEWDVSKVTIMNDMFDDCNALVDISPLKDWDVSKVTNMKAMFWGCRSLSDLSSLKYWDVSNVENMWSMFSNCNALVDILALKYWDISKVSNMRAMFAECNSLSDLSPLRVWDVSNVNMMRAMFYKCISLRDLSPMKNWDVSNVNMMRAMFYGCSSLSDLSGLRNWDVSNVRNVAEMFYNCISLVDISPLKDWDVSNIKYMEEMFYNCSSLVDVSSLNDWEVSKTADIEDMFSSADSIQTYPEWKDKESNPTDEDGNSDFDKKSSEVAGGKDKISYIGVVPFPAYEGDEPYAFVSYSHKDHEIVYQELQRFHDQGLNVWYDEGIAPGTEWLAELGEALLAASLFIVFISSNSIDSKYIKKEIRFAISHDIPFIAIHLEKTQLPVQFDFALGDLQAIHKFGMPDEEYYRRYIKAFNKHLKKYGIKLKDVGSLDNS